MKCALIATEASSDQLAVPLMLAFKDAMSVQFEGVAGPKMVQAGCRALFSITEFNVMGLVEVLPHAFRLMRIRQHLLKHWRTHPPDIIIAIDAPDFNLPLLKRLKGIAKCIQYVCPSFWAWRKYRLKQLKKYCHGVLTIFPFECAALKQQAIPHHYMGHPVCATMPYLDESARLTLRSETRAYFNIPNDQPILCMMPGIRPQEKRFMTPIFEKTWSIVKQKIPNIMSIWPGLPSCTLPHVYHLPNATLAMACADIGLIKSGTSTLQAMCAQLPMVVAYRMHALSYYILKRLLYTSWISLPNILANRMLVPEYIQHKMAPSALASALVQQWTTSQTAYRNTCRILHESLQPAQSLNDTIAWLLTL
jgi:lipid-A-disaccharide synthase